MNSKVPYTRLLFFKEKLELDQSAENTLREHSRLFAERKEEFSAYFEDFFSRIEQTKHYLEVQDYPGRLQKIWEKWFEGLFSGSVDHSFLDIMWKSGTTHVKINLDHRYVNLSYCLARSFCRKIIREQVPVGQQNDIGEAVEKILDLCLLIETDAFITNTYQCDREVIMGIAHQIRNPLTVIGGNIMRLKRIPDSSDNMVEGTYETILGESRRMEKMVNEVCTYNEIFHKHPEWQVLNLHEQLIKVIEECKSSYSLDKLDLQIGFAPLEIMILGDPWETGILLSHVLNNAFEGVDPENPLITVQTSLDPGNQKFALVEVFNTGVLTMPDDPKQLFTPFYSTKSAGTGMGLSIARAAARKIKGHISLYLAPGGGVICMVSLPRSDSR